MSAPTYGMELQLKSGTITTVHLKPMPNHEEVAIRIDQIISQNISGPCIRPTYLTLTDTHGDIHQFPVSDISKFTPIFSTGYDKAVRSLPAVPVNRVVTYVAPSRNGFCAIS